MLPLPGFELKTAQSVGSRCSPYVTPVSVGHRKPCELLFRLFLVLRKNTWTSEGMVVETRSLRESRVMVVSSPAGR